MTATIRPLKSTDADALYPAWEALRQHYASTDRRIVPTPISTADFQVAIAELCGRAEACAFVAEDGGEIVGFISGAIERNQPDRIPELHATVGYLYIVPDRRREGLARRLLGQLFQWAREQDGVAHVEMTVLANDDEAAAFWHSQGFTPFIQRLWAPLDSPMAP